MSDEKTTRYYGKFRGTVVNNVDPEQRGRIQAIVPDVQGLIPITWALPCVPLAGKQEGVFMVPQVGAGVWIEFEQGDPEYPIWVGGFWGAFAEVQAAALTP
ncbi:MAG: phage baseplate assembly protein V, partial [Candidatus Binatia bacterium]